MFLELIATVFAGIGAAGVVLLVNRLGGGRLPKWVMPVAAGLTMIGVTIASEQGWASRTMAELPPEMTVLREVEHRAPWKPWTYLYPQVTRLIVLDTASVQTKPDAPAVRLADLYLFGRWQRPSRVPQLVDCDRRARADVSDITLADPSQAAWVALPQDDPLIARLCPATD